MRFVCESCRAQYMINDEKVGPKGVKVRCRKCGYVILVKRPDAAKAGGPVAMSNDPDDALATQVMQTPLAAAEATLSNEDTTNAGDALTNPGVAAEPKPGDSFFGADEDEIGAVFDQVLKTGSNPAHKPADGEVEDRHSTKVIDADTVRKLAEESSGREAAGEEKPEDVPQTDWYVAIHEKQTGPLTLDKIKEHWDNGDITPDSLCWRAGFDDWVPVSTVKSLASVLAPKPPKPIVVAPAATITHSNAPAVVSVPVQSAFSAGGVTHTVQSEVQVPMAAAASSNIADREESGTWKPSAASALASLVRDEMEALAKPPAPSAPPPPAAEESGGGLLDLPAEEKPAPAPVAARPPPPAAPPVNPYLQNPGATYSAPAVTQYRPPSNRGLMVGVALGGVFVLLVLVGLVVWLASRPQQVVVAQPTPVQQPVAVAQPPPTPAPTPVPVPTPTPAPVAAAPTATADAGTAPVAAAPEAAPQPTAVATAPSPAPAPAAAVSPKTTQPKTSRSAIARNDPEPAPAPEPKRAASSGGGDDDFDKAFGGSSAPKKEEPVAAKKGSGYIPPPPGASAADVKESLAQSDIMEVVLSNKSALANCVSQQKAKDPGTSGKLLMRWTIQTSGKTSNVGVASDEFKGTFIATCVGGLIKGWTFPKHKKQGEPITFPFKF
ncbi:MAG: gliding motility protein [Archangium gephyra]|uniref:Gliding motility protein n=1 Tax=Archangium gephyra TaxID=48 RepID=A0A2W5V7P0_9BACT|nr:MAG: gliding motility protein [Archangium gephyra]